jgi:hypothetical protein
MRDWTPKMLDFLGFGFAGAGDSKKSGSSRVSLEHVNVDGKRRAVKIFLQS